MAKGDYEQKKYQTAEEYLARRYEIQEEKPDIPMKDEAFVAAWDHKPEMAALDFLTARFSLPVERFVWRNPKAVSLTTADSMGGRLPVVGTSDHRDFCNMTALLNGLESAPEYPLTVNAFTMQARAKSIRRHRLLLLNNAPYSNISSQRLGLDKGEWLERSHRLRLRHECVHYETLRLFGEMKNHALDEIAADVLGQIAAFGRFDADRQRLFFGLERGKDICTGRLSFYCQNVLPEERGRIYIAVNEALEGIEAEINELQAAGAETFMLLRVLLGRSIRERIS